VAYAPFGVYRVENERLPWTLLATRGEGVEAQRWCDVVEPLVWLVYQ
jgi:hypothetical protein